MLQRLILVSLCVLVLGSAGPAWADLDPDLLAWWPFDEGEGTVAYDGSGNGNDGTFSGSPMWATGYLDGGLEFNGSDSQVVAPHIALDSRSFTIAMWINPVVTASAIVFSQNESSSTDLNLHIRLGASGSDDAPDHGIRFGFYSNDLVTDGGLFEDNAWCHVVCLYDYENQDRRIYLNGEQIAQGSSTAFLGTSGDTIIGAWTSSQYFDGIIDDVQLYSRALSDSDIVKIMSGLVDMSIAQTPSPASGATDVPRDVVLEWDAGEFAATHDVYLGTSSDDVSNGAGTLVSQSQTAASYAPDSVLEFGQTYCWRVDEVNAAPDSTVYPGEVWSFTVEPFAYAVENIVVTSNGTSADDAGPENTINGSGLNADDQHSTESADMWLATPGAEPLYIQYEFDQVCKLDEMLVWNYNVQFEPMLGFGLKDVTVEYSADGVEWTVLGDVQLAQATAVATYEANTSVDFGGAPVKYVRLTVNSAYGAGTMVGLSEVRFMSIPAFAREPEPADQTLDVDVETDLTWRAGREAVTHDVYFGTDPGAPALVDSVSVPSFTPGDLAFGTVYSWKIDEVNEADAVTVWEGDPWIFATQEFATIEDFESYDNDENPIYDSWIDGWTNGTGSTAGYLTEPFAERSIVNSGAQSLPLAYDNSIAPYYSEVSYEVGSPDWTSHEADTLVVNFQGRAATFTEWADGSILMGAGGTDIWGTSDQFRFAYKPLTGDGSITVRVDSVYNSNGWAKAGVMIRQSTMATAVNAGVFVTPSNGISFQYRETAGSDSANVAEAGLTAPYWVKLTRTGDVFASQYSADGVTWTDLSEAELDMSGTVYIGLALTSHDASIMTNAEFSNVTVSAGGAWEVEAIGVDQPGNAAEPLYVAIEDASGNIATVTHPDAEAALATAWTSWEIPFSEFVGVNLAQVQTLYLGLGNPDNPSAGGAGLIYVDDIGYGRPGTFAACGEDSAVMFADGTDIWGTSDEFRFAYRQLTGDGTITARVDSLVNTNSWAKAGVMIRQDLTGEAANAALAVTPENGISFQYRAEAGASSGNTAVGGMVAPYWVQLTRTGDVFTAQYSADGATWVDLVTDAAVSVPMDETVYVGLALTSHADGTITVAEFSNVEASDSVSGDWQVQGIGLD